MTLGPCVGSQDGPSPNRQLPAWNKYLSLCMQCRLILAFAGVSAASRRHNKIGQNLSGCYALQADTSGFCIVEDFQVSSGWCRIPYILSMYLIIWISIASVLVGSRVCSSEAWRTSECELIPGGLVVCLALGQQEDVTNPDHHNFEDITYCFFFCAGTIGLGSILQHHTVHPAKYHVFKNYYLTYVFFFM